MAWNVPQSLGLWESQPTATVSRVKRGDHFLQADLNEAAGQLRSHALMSTQWSASAMVVFSSYFRKGIPTGGVLRQVKLVICYWKNTGQRVANGTIALQLRAPNSNKTREQR